MPVYTICTPRLFFFFLQLDDLNSPQLLFCLIWQEANSSRHSRISWLLMMIGNFFLKI